MRLRFLNNRYIFTLYSSLAFLCFLFFRLHYSYNTSDGLPQNPSDGLTQGSSQLNITTYANYCVHGNVIVAENRNYESIGQYLHISYDYLDEKLVEQVENWKAPLSVAIILNRPSAYYCALEKLLSMRQQSALFREYVNAHFVFKSEGCSVSEQATDCETGPGLISNISAALQALRQNAEYPANVGRNVARQFLKTRFMVIADLEQLFSENFEREVFEIAKNYLITDPKRLLIYRFFNVDEEESPKSIEELKHLYNTNRATTFHAKHNYVGHYIRGVEDWFNGNEERPGIHIADIQYDRHYWEPQFVSVADIPQHDTSFPFRKRNNNVLRWELCRAGYKWSVLSKHFVYHKKILSTSTDILTIIRYLNMDRFNKVLKEFNVRMDVTYPETKKTCPDFIN